MLFLRNQGNLDGPATSNQKLNILLCSWPGVVIAQMAIEDFFDEFMELLGAISAEGATLSTLEVWCWGVR